MMNEYFPQKPIGCFLDYTYCASPHCTNKCGRKMSESIRKWVEEENPPSYSMANFCGDK